MVDEMNHEINDEKKKLMSADQKKRFEAMLPLCERAWAQFNERRRYEFKVSLSFWTAIALAVAGSVKLENFPDIPGGIYTLFAASVFIVVCHSFWCWGIRTASKTDQEIAYFYERELQSAVTVEFDEKLKKRIERIKNRCCVLKSWSYVFQVSITVCLLASLILVNWGRFKENGDQDSGDKVNRSAGLERPVVHDRIRGPGRLPPARIGAHGLSGQGCSVPGQSPLLRQCC